MRKSRVLHKLRSGLRPSCTKINLIDPRVAEIAALCGMDCVWVDQEHIGHDWSTLAANIWATKSQDIDILVRVSRGGYSDYIKPLELDATGIMVPHVMGVEDAKKVIRMTRFHPLGRRAMDGGNNDADYTMMDFNEYIETANRERFIILQIEDPEPLKELEEIAALPGFDMLFFGPGDFSQGIGAPGQWNHPEIQAARQQVVTAAKKHGKFAGTVGSPANVQDLYTMGYDFVSMGADVVALSAYFKEIANHFSGEKEDTTSQSYLENQEI